MPGSIGHVASSDEWPQGLSLLGRDKTHWRQSHCFSLNSYRGQSTGFVFATTHLGPQQRKGGMDWSCVRRVWSKRHWGEMWGSGCGIFCAGIYLESTAPISLDGARPSQGKSNYLTLWDTSLSTLWNPAPPPCIFFFFLFSYGFLAYFCLGFFLSFLLSSLSS